MGMYFMKFIKIFVCEGVSFSVRTLKSKKKSRFQKESSLRDKIEQDIV